MNQSHLSRPSLSTSSQLHKPPRRPRASVAPRDDPPRRTVMQAENHTQDTTVSLIQNLSRDSYTDDTTTNLTRHFQPALSKRPVSAIIAERLSRPTPIPEEAGDETRCLLKKEARRRTIYVSQDATIDTIHPGAWKDETIRLQDQRAVRRGSMLGKEGARRRKSILAPQNSTYASQEPVGDVTRVLERVDRVPMKDTRRRQSIALLPRKPKPELAIAMPIMEEEEEKRPALVERSNVGNRLNIKMEPPKADKKYIDNIHAPLKRPVDSKPITWKTSQTSVIRTTSTRPLSSLKASMIAEDLLHPELYEEGWLEHQEIAITEVLNAFFQTNRPQKRQSREELRRIFLKQHNSSETALLAKKLQASLTYGSLTVPKELLHSSIRLRDDIGQRRKFFELLLDTYNPSYLHAALEAVVGRECLVRLHTASSPPDRKSLEAYMDRFLIHHEDANFETSKSGFIGSLARSPFDTSGSPEWYWKRTTLRCLLLIRLLDGVKTTDQVHECLLLHTSTLKSSEAVLKELGTILLPSYGDLTRPLKHLGYALSAQQTGLQEIDLAISNIAVDLRDSIRLAQLAVMLGGTNVMNEIKHPASSRATKLYNASLAVGSLRSIPDLASDVLEGISAEDIVDGHRERNVTLLFGLVGRFSTNLLNWQALRSEIHHFRSLVPAQNQDLLSKLSHHGNTEDKLEGRWRLLFLWAQAIAAVTGLSIRNLTTSFASGSALGAILQAYARYLPSRPSSNAPTAILNTLGISPSFSSLLSLNSSTKATTLTTLLFLASTLLPLATRHRAASRIQKAYRLRLARNEVHRRVVLMRLASECLAVVRARDRVIGAAIVIQRAWRSVLNRKISLLERDVGMFQSIAKGWMVRNGIRKRKGLVRQGRVGW